MRMLHAGCWVLGGEGALVLRVHAVLTQVPCRVRSAGALAVILMSALAYVATDAGTTAWRL